MTDDLDRILAERREIYGEFPDNAAVAQAFKKALRGAKNYDILTDVHLEAFDNVLQKIARVACGDVNHIDSIDDMINYLRLLKFYIETKVKIGQLK